MAGPHSSVGLLALTGKQFFDWQTGGGTDDVMRMVDCVERGDVAWCAIGGMAVNHWAARLVEAHPELRSDLPKEVETQVTR